MINIQPVEELANQENGSFLEVHSVFSTFQGEGPLTGHPAIFVRLAGCNLQCPGCDTDYTSKRETVSVERLMQMVRTLHPGPRLVVITGGEPFRQNISLFCMLLLDEDYQVQVETNGTLPPPPGFPASVDHKSGVWIVCSPKTPKIHPHTRDLVVAFKYVLTADSVFASDGLPFCVLRLGQNVAIKPVARPPEHFLVGAIYLQPADEKDPAKNEANLQAVMKSCERYGYTLQLQLHKILNVE